jgi:hypothetical protein
MTKMLFVPSSKTLILIRAILSPGSRACCSKSCGRLRRIAPLKNIMLIRHEPRSSFRSQGTHRNSRSRSRSPRCDEKVGDQRRRSPPRTKPPVCLVDVRQMYIHLRTCFGESNASLVKVATELGLTGDDKTMCAGNESR